MSPSDPAVRFAGGPLCDTARVLPGAAWRTRDAGRRITILNNMVTPYTNRLYDVLWKAGVALSVVSCTRQEANRSWGDVAAPRYPHEVLPGRALRLGSGRFAHVNFGVGAALKRTAPDFLFINGIYPTMLRGVIWALMNGTPLGLMSDGWRETMPMSPAHRLVRPLVLSRCRAVVTAGVKGAAYFRDALPNGRVFTVPLVPAWDPPAAVPGFAERPFHLLWCAHLNDAAKNVSFFVEVAEVLKRRLPDLKVRLVGQGEKQQEVLDRLAKAAIDFRHDPSLDWRDMAEVYASARLLLLPSVWEPWGLVCNEALQCGVPCVVSPHVGAADDAVISGSNGFVVRLDCAEWADRITLLLTDERLWKEFSAQARAITAERSLAHSAAAFIEMLGRL